VCLRTAALAAWAAVPGCAPPVELPVNDASVVLAHQTLDAPHPGRPGAYPVGTLYYGSGTDRRRPEYRDSVAFTTPSVDASKLVRLGERARSRNRYWGFSPKNFPLNARVWYPEGPGPFPLVLIVHGNHNMRDFSDPGYGYLGRLLASRGFILASIDMNFVNGAIRGENDGRGWLLLKHVEAWKRFNEDATNPFHGKVDLDRIALIGHSRGGEAVGHAAAFNRLYHYPDDASQTFDFGFNIRSIIAIAPVDGQYLPTGRKVPVENINYLVFHGSNDGDVTAFHGLRLFHRLRFTDGKPWFKAAVYVYGANHGQWNTVWGNHDNGPRSGRILDLGTLIDPEWQREFARIYISAFLEATLHDDDRYLPIFRDHRTIGQWLPPTMYISRFQESSFRPLATFEEDIDVTSGTPEGVVIAGDSLATWKEETVPLRSRNRRNTSSSQENQAVWLGWNNRIAGSDTTVRGPPARYALSVPESYRAETPLEVGSSLDFVLAPTFDVPPPRKNARDGTGQGKGGPRQRSDRSGPDADQPPIDLSIEVRDAAGHAARVPLSRYGAIRRPLRMSILRRKDQERQRFNTLYELVLQSFSIPLGDFVAAAPDLDPGRITEVAFVFDRAVAGTVIVDDIGFSHMNPAFFRTR